MKKVKLHYAWLILFGAVLIRGFAGGGINMTSGLFLYPVSRELGIGIGSLSIYFSITSIVTVLWLPYAGKLINRYDIRIMVLAGAVLQALTFMAFGLLNQVYGWYLLSIPYAMGAAILVSLLGPILINRWFSGNAGLMMGIQMAFVGLFGAVFQPVTSGIIERQGWRTGYFTVGGITFAIAVLTALFLLRDRPEDKGLSPYGADMPAAEKEIKHRDSKDVEIEEKTAVHSVSFILLLLFMVSITGIGVFAQHIPNYGSLLGYTAGQVGIALSYASIGSAAGSIAIGIVSDRIGGLKTCYGMIGIGFFAVVGFMLGKQVFPIFCLSAFLHGLISSGIMVLGPVLTLKFYGQTDYEKIFAKVAMGAPLASIILIPAYGFIYDMTESYRGVLMIMLLLLASSLLCITVGWKKRRTQTGCPGWRE